MLLNILLQAAPVVDTLANAVQDTAAIAAPATESSSYMSFILKGGIMIYPLVALLFFCIYVIIERFLYINKAIKLDPTMLADVKTELKHGRVENAVLICNRQNTSSGKILRTGIRILGRPISEIESVMERSANVEIAGMEKGLGKLGLISGIAPILGFIGTIMGVIKIFHTISTTGNLNIQSISGGLYEKMISSGAGLVVGVIAFSAYHIFNIMIDKYTHNVEKQILELINIIHEPDGN